MPLAVSIVEKHTAEGLGFAMLRSFREAMEEPVRF